MHESTSMEFKQSFTKSFLKTVSAYANYGTGEVLFGVNDEGEVVGLENPKEVRLSIENAINDALDPCPNYFLETKEEEGKAIVALTVYEGLEKPYLCSGKAYRRSDTATVAVDRSELRRLSIEGSVVPFDEMISQSQDLTFGVLASWLKDRLRVESISEDTWKTLGLLRQNAFNNAAALLADFNSFPGIDVVRYAYDDVSIHERLTYEGVSVLEQLDQAIEEFRKHYLVERVEGMLRQKYEVVPEDAFREAVANALVHRMWYVNARTIVSLYPDRIEIVSPGGLPNDIDETLYLEGGVSVPRNAELAYVFLRLGIIERLGTGISRIQRAYGESVAKPSFLFSAHAIKVILPALSDEDELSSEERAVLAAFKPGLELTSANLEETMGLSRSTVVRLISALAEKGVLMRVGRGPATRYRLT